ncbi:MAG TPA: CBS domain-containing protein [Pyrinomonadaceae bacterium]|nr:CBS domain-containing protein [Pyrinomonadaceae bacterium]
MSRYRDDRDDYYGGGARREDERRGRDFRDGAPDERDFRDRDYFRNDYGTGAVGRRGEARDYERRDERPPSYGYRGREERDYDGGGRGDRPTSDDGRDYYARRAYGRGRTSRSHVRCRDIMTRDVTVATRDATLEEVARMMRDEDTGVIPVVEREGDAAPGDAAADAGGAAQDAPARGGGESAARRRAGAGLNGNGRLVGLITDRDIVVRALAEGRDARATRAEEIMTAEVHAAHPNDRVIDAIRKMGDKQVRRIPIVDRDGILRGIISMADVALETNDDRELAEALEEISSGHSFWNRVFG